MSILADNWQGSDSDYFPVRIDNPENTVKPVWNEVLWKDHPVWKDHFPISENVYLPLDSIQTEPVWNNHLSGKTTLS